MNPSKLLQAFNEAAEVRPKSRYLLDGTHELTVSKVETVETQDGPTVMFVEYTVRSTHGTSLVVTKKVDGQEQNVEQEPHEVGEEVKQSFPTDSAPQWLIKRTMSTLKRMCSLAGVQYPSNEDDLKVLMGVEGAESPLVGSFLRVVGTRSISNNGAHFTKYDYMATRMVETPEVSTSTPEDSEDSTPDLSGDVPF